MSWRAGRGHGSSGGLVAGTAGPGADLGHARAVDGGGGQWDRALGLRGRGDPSMAARNRILARERCGASGRAGSGLSRGPARSASASVAAMLTDKLPLLDPTVFAASPGLAARGGGAAGLFLARRRWFSWAVALILAVAGPLIPVFMALVGLAARPGRGETSDGRDRITLGAWLGERFLRRDRHFPPARTRAADGGPISPDRARGVCAPRHHGGAAGGLPVLDGAGSCSRRSLWRWWRSNGRLCAAGRMGLGAWATPPDPGRGGVSADAGARVRSSRWRDLAAAWARTKAAALAVAARSWWRSEENGGTSRRCWARAGRAWPCPPRP